MASSKSQKNTKKQNTNTHRSFNFATALAILIIGAVIIGIASWDIARDMKFHAQIREYERRQQEVSQQIEYEKDRTVAIQEKKKYMQTKQFTEEVAKDKFKLVYPDEVILQRKEK